jgi:hypothetical protein
LSGKLLGSLNKKTITIVIVAVVVVAAVTVALSSVLFSGPKVPNVKFVAFNTEGKQIMKENQQKSITFKIKNFESYEVSNARVLTTLQGDPKFFVMTDNDITVTPPIAGPNGETRDFTVTIMGVNLGGQQAIEDKIAVTLYVGVDVTDKREFEVRLEK